MRKLSQLMIIAMLMSVKAWAGPAVDQACKESFFKHREKIRECKIKGTRPAVIRSCASQSHFGKTWFGVECAIHAKAPAVVRACDWSFGGEDIVDALDCSIHAKSPAVITTCGLFFSDLGRRLGCSLQARSPNRIKNCNQQFKEGSQRALRCSIR